jgi:hypothetical protein
MNAWFGRVGSSDALPDKMPSIWLVTDPSCPEGWARLVADGCEEEGIPLAWDVKQGDSSELAHFASLSAKLEVGIGVGCDKKAAISVVSVPDRPYISRQTDAGEQLRWLGQAAARISKSQPLPDEHISTKRSSKFEPAVTCEPAAATDSFANDEIVNDEIVSLVRMVTDAILKMQKEGDGRHGQR